MPPPLGLGEFQWGHELLIILSPQLICWFGKKMSIFDFITVIATAKHKVLLLLPLLNPLQIPHNPIVIPG